MRGHLWQQLERLEHEADVLGAPARAPVLVEREQVLADAITFPELGRSRPASRPSKVDLPEPDAPTIATVSPDSTVKPTRRVSSAIRRRPVPLAQVLDLDRCHASQCSPSSRRPRRGTSVVPTRPGLSCGAACRRGWLAGTSTLVAAAALPRRAVAQSAKPLLVLGDSLSAEYGLPRGSGWVALLEKRIAQQRGGSPRIVNASVSGETTAGGTSRLPDLLARHAPEWW
jgi:acyl-CoA thioesterase-1